MCLLASGEECSAGGLCGVGRMLHIGNSLSTNMFTMRSKFVKKNYPQLSGHKKAPRWRGGEVGGMNILKKIFSVFSCEAPRPLECKNTTGYDIFAYCPDCLWTPENLNSQNKLVCKKCGTYLVKGVGRVYREYTYYGLFGLGNTYIEYHCSKFLPKGASTPDESNDEKNQ